MTESTDQFREAIRSIGMNPPDIIEPGEMYRFPGAGKRNGNTAGWCKLFDDGMGGVYGDYSRDISEHWQADRSAPLTPAQRDAFFRVVQESKAQAEAVKLAKQSESATRAAAIWRAAQPASDQHAYLVCKGIKANGARLYRGPLVIKEMPCDGALIIPMREGAALHSLQFIGEDGIKRHLSGGRKKGCYFSIGTPKGAAALCITEGYATGATIYEATGLPVAVAIDAGNLEPVAIAMRERLPDMPLIVCADDDAGTEGNPGMTKATAAALAVGGKLAIPDFGESRPEGATDFNDMAGHCGTEAVQRAIESANAPAIPTPEPTEANAPKRDIEGWLDPQPLTAKVNPEPYPFDALPETIREAIIEVQGFTKAPIPMVASSALAALSVAIQAHADIRRADKLTGPSSLFLLTIADSGERKSTCDGFFTQAIREYEAKQAEDAKPAVTKYLAAIQAWDAKHGGIKDKIRQLSKASQPTGVQEARLSDLEGNRPHAPMVPRLMRGDETPEHLALVMAKEWPSGAVISAEAGIIFGAHGMGKDSVMRNLALLNILWDGGTLSIGRKTSESFTLRGARLTVALQIQDATLRSFFDRSGTLARGTGFLARFLVAWPESTQGFRQFTEPPASWPALARFNQRIAEILAQQIPLDAAGTLAPAARTLSPEAKAAWVAYYDAIECELKSGGELYDVRDVASKSADNAARIAALFHVFEACAGDIVGVESIAGASRIAAWHLNEARRFFGEFALPPELAAAARLEAWLIDYCKRKHVATVPIAALLQCGPGSLRKRDAYEAALRELRELDRARLETIERRKSIAVNPALLDGGAA